MNKYKAFLNLITFYIVSKGTCTFYHGFRSESHSDNFLRFVTNSRCVAPNVGTVYLFCVRSLTSKVSLSSTENTGSTESVVHAFVESLLRQIYILPYYFYPYYQCAIK